MSITSVKINAVSPAELGGSTVVAPASGPDFSSMLAQGISEVSQTLNQASEVSEEYMVEGRHSLHEVMIALEQADVSFRYMTEVRNKVLDAYSEVMRMQV